MTISTTTPMRLEHFHDFYFLQALEAAVKREVQANPEKQFSKAVDKLQADIEDAIDVFVPNIALRTFVYLYAACLGEARHARESTARERFIPTTLSLHRTQVYETITEFRPTAKNIQALVNIFDQDWHSGFGGKAWMKIAEALKMYLSHPPASFIDHVIDLEHNGGTAFNKEDALRPLHFCARYPGRLSHFLDYKFEKDILTKPPSFTTKLSVMPKTYALANRYSKIFGKIEVSWIEPELDTLTDYLVEWGDGEIQTVEKWMEWADVHKGNKPTVNGVMAMMNLENIIAQQHTEAELTKKVKDIKKKTLGNIRTHLTPYLKKGINKKVNEWLEWAFKYCKQAKKEHTYSVLPCKVWQLDPNNTFLCFPIPYDGYGTPKSYGFEVKLPAYTLYDELHGTEPGFDDDKKKYLDGHVSIHSTYLGLHLNNNVWYFTDQKLEAFLD